MSAEGDAGARPALGGDLSCGRCGAEKRARDLDRHLWCEACVARAKGEASRFGWAAGVALAVAFAAWIRFVERPSTMLIGGWIGAVLATLWLGARVGRELSYGVLRFRGRPR